MLLPCHVRESNPVAVSKTIVSGILPWDFSPGIRRNKIRSVNLQIKDVVAEMNNNFITYIDPDHTWTSSGGALNTNHYFKDNLHLIEKGNEKLAKAITTALNMGCFKQQQPQHQCKNQHQELQRKHQQKNPTTSTEKPNNINTNANSINKKTTKIPKNVTIISKNIKNFDK